MSFSGNVKDELAGHVPGARHCQIAELAAILQFCAGIVKTQSGKNLLRFFLVERQFVANFALKKNLKNNRK